MRLHSLFCSNAGLAPARACPRCRQKRGPVLTICLPRPTVAFVAAAPAQPAAAPSAPETDVAQAGIQPLVPSTRGAALLELPARRTRRSSRGGSSIAGNGAGADATRPAAAATAPAATSVVRGGLPTRRARAAAPGAAKAWEEGLTGLEADVAVLCRLEAEARETHGYKVLAQEALGPMASRILTSPEEQALARLIDWGRSTEGAQPPARGRKRSGRADSGSSSSSSAGDGGGSGSGSGVRDDSQEAQMARMTAGRAQEVLVLFNKGLVSHMLNLLKPPAGFPRRDALHAGLTGLRTAAARFTADAGSRFSTYATLWIKTAARRAYDSQRGLVRVPDYQYTAVRHCYMHYPGLFDPAKPREEREKLLAAAKATNIFRSQSHSITLDEFDALVRGSEASSLEALEFANGAGKANADAGRETLGSMLSSDDLDSALGDAGSGVGAASVGGAAGNGGGAGGGAGAEEGVTVEEEALVERLLATLTEKERRAVELTMLGGPVSAEVLAQQPPRSPRPGGERKVVLRVASKELGVSTEGVRQLRKRAVAKLAALARRELAAGGAEAEELGAAVGADVSAFVGDAASATKAAAAEAAAAVAGQEPQRPKGRPRAQKAGEAAPAPAPVAAAALQAEPPCRRGRKPRAAAVPEAPAAATEAAVGVPAGASQAAADAPAPRRRGRPPRSASTREAAAAPSAVLAPAAAALGDAQPPRRRGRKPRAASAAAAAATTPSPPGFSSGVVVCNAHPRWQPAGGAAV